ncbi:NADPH-dependent 2,4-dienoyl-CoA reductase/sulfur reductase-like enzyme/peroxiredoxin family protein/rhodanese-related sulfurtransferase/TusA-related sulfurtransferase [Bacilli bacterium PM5-3]|nr:NADPH-dependent 2,4-dienoyl-CoA reductase/sulfur reductase-like enzyme/peroxiredoxin family protein/rhodanese-related sulfurtransferase/TusA-related sulfurtransferase [Bacilli bacterium PM5-3]
MKRKIVIVGGVALGASAAARLRRLNEQDEIILLEKDEYISFANCGLPYYIGDVIKERDNLIVQTKEGMMSRFNIDVRNFSEAIKINREKKYVIVKDRKNNCEYNQDYDILILAPGASPTTFPIDGAKDANNIFKLRNIPDTDMIKKYIIDNEVKDAVVVGAGFIGLEMAENLSHLGINVTVVDLADQVMQMFDDEMAKLIQNAMEIKNIKFKLKTSVTKFEENGRKVILSDGTTLSSDMNVMAIGVTPDTQLAVAAGLEIGKTKGIKVNEYNQTSDPSIYAGGDVIEVEHFISKQPTYIPLAWPANRQGRLIADHINGIKTRYNGSLGSAVIKVFDNVAAATGLSEKAAKAQGYNVKSLHIHRGNHAGYYPNSSTITLKLIYDGTSKLVLGAQAFGQDGTEKRIDVIATAIKLEATIDKLSDFELCYAPPFSSAKDPVNIAGYVATNLEDNMYEMFYVQDVANLNDVQFIDVRSKEEYDLSHIEKTINIDVDILRSNLEKIDFNKDIYLTCQVGLRGYLAARILKENGFEKNIYNLSGGYKLYSEYVMDTQDLNFKQGSNSSNDEQTSTINKSYSNKETIVIDACGLQCPGPIIKLKEGIDNIDAGEAIDIVASDFGFYRDVQTWCDASGNELVYSKMEDGKVKARIIKHDEGVNISDVQEQRQTIVAFSNDFDKLIATFIIANGALAMGSKVSIFFTFWGLSALRKDNYISNKNKSTMDKLFAKMLPKGTKKTNLSKMSMFGLGSKMMRFTMKNHNVDTLESLMQQFIDSGGKIIACAMSMDVMGISKEELIDGIEYGGVATYIGDAQKSYSNLFI